MMKERRSCGRTQTQCCATDGHETWTAVLSRVCILQQLRRRMISIDLHVRPAQRAPLRGPPASEVLREQF
jgi:hypothetical protein